MTVRKEASTLSIGTLISLLVVTIGGATWAGALANDVENLKEEKVQQKEDHDRLIKVEGRIENIEDDVAETKEDVKQILKELRKRED